MEHIQKYLRLLVSLACNSSSDPEEEHVAKRQVVLSGFSLDRMIHHSDFYLLTFLKPESIFQLILVNKRMTSLLTEDVIDKYGEKIKPTARELLNGCGISYRTYFLQQLRRSSFADYKLDGKLVFLKNGEEHIEPLLSYLLLERNWLNQRVKFKEILVSFTPLYHPLWLRDEGTAEIVSTDILNRRTLRSSLHPFNVGWKTTLVFNGKTKRVDAELIVLPEKHWFDDESMNMELSFDGTTIGNFGEELIGEKGKEEASKIARLFNLNYASEVEKSLSMVW